MSHLSARSFKFLVSLFLDILSLVKYKVIVLIHGICGLRFVTQSDNIIVGSFVLIQEITSRTISSLCFLAKLVLSLF